MKRFTKQELRNIIREEVVSAFREEDQEGSEGEADAAGAAKEQGMKSNVQRVAKFMFKSKQLGPALEKIKGNVEAAQLLGLLAQELGVEPADIGSVMTKVKRSMGDEELEEGRYNRTPYQGDDPRAISFDEIISVLDDLQYDSLEDDVSSYADDAVRALSKAIEELEYKRNTVGNDPDADAARKSNPMAEGDTPNPLMVKVHALSDMLSEIGRELPGRRKIPEFVQLQKMIFEFEKVASSMSGGSPV